ncbi:MAG: GNA1162 family protein [Desulfobulbaceae bacterium]
MNRKIQLLLSALFGVLLVCCAGCAKQDSQKGIFFNELVDFASIETVAVLPFQNLSDDSDSAERVRDVLMGMLLATEAVYVLPPGEVQRAISRVGIVDPAAPSIEEIKSLAGILQVDVVITGVVREYQLVRSGSSTANIISLSLQMIETETGTIIWSASSTKGGITLADRMLGGGGEPMNDVTLESIDDLLNKLFQ